MKSLLLVVILFSSSVFAQNVDWNRYTTQTPQTPQTQQYQLPPSVGMPYTPPPQPVIVTPPVIKVPNIPNVVMGPVQGKVTIGPPSLDTVFRYLQFSPSSHYWPHK